MEEGQSEAFTNFAKANGAWDEGENAVNPGRLKQLRRLAQDALQEHAPKRLQFLQQEADLSQKADAEFPWLKDRKSEQYGLFQKVVEGLPEVRRLPDWKAICAIYVLGLQHVAKATAAKANGGKPPVRAGAGTPARQPQPRLPGAAAAVPQRPAPGAEGNIVALREKAMKSGKTRDFVDLIKAQLDAA
jgi:hypothetical protein